MTRYGHLFIEALHILDQLVSHNDVNASVVANLTSTLSAVKSWFGSPSTSNSFFSWLDGPAVGGYVHANNIGTAQVGFFASYALFNPSNTGIFNKTKVMMQNFTKDLRKETYTTSNGLVYSPPNLYNQLDSDGS